MAKKRRIKSGTSVVYSLTEVNTNFSVKTHVPVSMIIIILLAGLMIGAIWQKVKIGQLKARIVYLKQQIQVLEENNEKETAKKLNLLSDYRIVQIAERKMELVFPPYEKIKLSKKFNENIKIAEQIINSEK